MEATPSTHLPQSRFRASRALKQLLLALVAVCLGFCAFIYSRRDAAVVEVSTLQQLRALDEGLRAVALRDMTVDEQVSFKHITSLEKLYLMDCTLAPGAHVAFSGSQIRSLVIKRCHINAVELRHVAQVVDTLHEIHIVDSFGLDVEVVIALKSIPHVTDVSITNSGSEDVSWSRENTIQTSN